MNLQHIHQHITNTPRQSNEHANTNTNKHQYFYQQACSNARRCTTTEIKSSINNMRHLASMHTNNNTHKKQASKTSNQERIQAHQHVFLVLLLRCPGVATVLLLRLLCYMYTVDNANRAQFTSMCFVRDSHRT